MVTDTLLQRVDNPEGTGSSERIWLRATLADIAELFVDARLFDSALEILRSYPDLKNMFRNYSLREHLAQALAIAGRLKDAESIVNRLSEPKRQIALARAGAAFIVRSDYRSTVPYLEHRAREHVLRSLTVAADSTMADRIATVRQLIAKRLNQGTVENRERDSDTGYQDPLPNDDFDEIERRITAEALTYQRSNLTNLYVRKLRALAVTEAGAVAPLMEVAADLVDASWTTFRAGLGTPNDVFAASHALVDVKMMLGRTHEAQTLALRMLESLDHRFGPNFAPCLAEVLPALKLVAALGEMQISHVLRLIDDCESNSTSKSIHSHIPGSIAVVLATPPAVDTPQLVSQIPALVQRDLWHSEASQEISGLTEWYGVALQSLRLLVIAGQDAPASQTAAILLDKAQQASTLWYERAEILGELVSIGEATTREEAFVQFVVEDGFVDHVEKLPRRLLEELNKTNLEIS